MPTVTKPTDAAIGGTAAAAAANAATTPAAMSQCTSPQDLFAVATALTMLFAKELNKIQLATLINLVALILAGLSAIVTQQQICAGEEIQAPI